MASTTAREVRDLLRQRDYVKLAGLCWEDHQYWKAVKFAVYEADESISWPAIEVAARLMQQHWESGDQERVREYIRNLLWSLNDESGGIGWNAPQTIAEIIIRIPELVEPYASMMISRTMEEPPLVANGLWAIGRLGSYAQQAVAFFWEIIRPTLISSDPQTLGVACWAMGEVGFAPAARMIQTLAGRSESVRIYIDGEFREHSLGAWATAALDKFPDIRYRNSSTGREEA